MNSCYEIKMPGNRHRIKNCLLFLISCLFAVSARGQSRHNTLEEKQLDTAAVRRMELLQRIGSQEARKSLQNYRVGRISIQQGIVMDEIRKQNEQLKIYLKNGGDTSAVIEELERTRNSLEIVGDGVFKNKGTSQTQRNLSVSLAITQELLSGMLVRKKALDTYASGLMRFKDKIDSLYSDSVIFTFPTDSASLVKYISRIRIMAAENDPVDSALNKAVVNVQELQLRVDQMVNQLRFSLDDIELYRKNVAAENINREFANLWDSATHSRPLAQILLFSVEKEKLALAFYIRDNLASVAILVLLLCACFVFLRSLKRELAKENLKDDQSNAQLVTRYPFYAAVVIIFGIFQFMFAQAPFVFSFCLWSLAAGSLSIIFFKYLNRYWRQYWFIMLALFFFAGLDNCILQSSRPERWGMLLLSLTGIYFACRILFGHHEGELRELSIMYFIGFTALAETISLFLNLFGRYNLSKVFLISGYSGVLIAVLLIWTARFINQGLALASRVYKSPDKKLFYINFDKVGDKLPALSYVLLVFGWIMLVGKNFYLFRQISEPLADFVTNQRTIGAYSFSIRGAFLFCLILFSSVFLSRIVSFFTGEPIAAHTGISKTPKVSLGSWMLLVRILIISAGVFLALAAAGIPLDRITIIIGALGVGIGLGLQGLVNNLVSGLIIAFEKPVNVGDLIELDGKMATMKSIGFRSSIVTMSDGATLIIPNGDLLSQHLVNWSMSRQIRRNSVVIGIGYGTDLPKTRHMLMDILTSNERILKHPAPSVLAKEFNQGSLDFELLFWVNTDWAVVRSEVMANIESVFAQEGIVIPVPRQELHIHAAGQQKPVTQQAGNGKTP